MKPDVSIIIPVYNSERLIGRTLKSIFNQQTSYTYEVIAVDDGSTDQSVDEINKFHDARIKIFRQKNAGPSTARNRGLRESRGRYVAFIDADDYWESRFIERTVSFLERAPECIAVSVGQKHLSVSGEAVRPICIDKYSVPIILDDFFDFWATYNHVCTGSVVVRREAVDKIGGFREDLLCNEDWEYWAMIGAYGKWGFIPEILFTSDGIDVSRSIGWVQKMRPRWYNAQSVDFWEERIKKEVPELMSKDGYKRKVGIIASDIALSLLLSQRECEAMLEVKKYGNYFERNRLTSLMKFCAKNGIMWRIMCKALNYREYHRSI